MKKFTIINRPTNFVPNYVHRVSEEKMKISNITDDTHKGLLEIFSLLRERLKTTSDSVDFNRVVQNVLGIIKERKTELMRIKKLEDMKKNAGFTLVSIIIIFGIVSFSFVVFLLFKNILY